MFASQLIYTGCGKDKTGAFSVWSKTLDITREEETEIREKMLYKRPGDLPFEPTQEDLDSLFPKKFGYFYLSSGRVCMAQSVYIGAVYSDLDSRTGNYIIHAFVFDKDENVLPMNFIGSDLFKCFLTYEEWHEQDAPAELPKMEISDKPSALSKQEIDAFFDEKRAKLFKSLLQAIINSFSNDQKVTFHDFHGNLKYWYKAISVCLPTYMQKKLTFNTFFTPTAPVPSHTQTNANAINTEVKIRNVSPKIASNIFNYQQDVLVGKYSFDFESGVVQSSIEISSYVKYVVELLGTNVFNVIMVVDSVGKISTKCCVDFDTALDIHFLLNGQIERIDHTEKLNSLIKYGYDFYNDLLPKIADYLYEFGLKSRRWNLTLEISNIYRFIFDYSETADKGDMIYRYVKNQSGFGVDINASEAEYCTSFKNNAPFAWENFLDFIFEGDNFTKYFETNGDSFNSRYLLFDTFAESLEEIAEDSDRKNTVLRYFVDTVKYYIQNEQFSHVISLVKRIGKCGAKWQGWIIEKSYSLLRKDGKRLSGVCSPSFTLKIAEACLDASNASRYVFQLIEENETREEFIKLYVEQFENNVSFYSDVFKNSENASKYESFLKKVQLYRFSISASVTKRQLQNYYNEYFAQGKDDSELFAKKLKQYLSQYEGKERVLESFSCYDLWLKENNAVNTQKSSCVDTICDVFFSISDDILKEYISSRGIQRIKEILSASSENYHVPFNYYVIAFGESIKRIFTEIRVKKKTQYIKDILEQLEEDTFYRMLKGEDAIDLFVKMYLPDVLCLYMAIATEDYFEEVYTHMFNPLCESHNFEQCFIDALEDMEGDNYELILSHTVICACIKNNKFNERLLKLVDPLLEKMRHGKRKKFFSQLLDNIPDRYKEKTKAFVEGYQKEHESLLGKILETFGKKNGDSNSKDKK